MFQKCFCCCDVDEKEGCGFHNSKWKRECGWLWRRVGEHKCFVIQGWMLVKVTCITIRVWADIDWTLNTMNKHPSPIAIHPHTTMEDLQRKVPFILKRCILFPQTINCPWIPLVVILHRTDNSSTSNYPYYRATTTTRFRIRHLKQRTLQDKLLRNHMSS